MDISLKYNKYENWKVWSVFKNKFPLRFMVRVSYIQMQHLLFFFWEFVRFGFCQITSAILHSHVISWSFYSFSLLRVHSLCYLISHPAPWQNMQLCIRFFLFKIILFGSFHSSFLLSFLLSVNFFLNHYVVHVSQAVLSLLSKLAHTFGAFTLLAIGSKFFWHDFQKKQKIQVLQDSASHKPTFKEVMSGAVLVFVNPAACTSLALDRKNVTGEIFRLKNMLKVPFLCRLRQCCNLWGNRIIERRANALFQVVRFWEAQIQR